MKAINVLLADDHVVLLDSLAMMISSLPGIHVVGKATNGEEALLKTKSDAVDIVLTDMHMPVMNGMDLALRLRDEKPGIRTILLTMEEEPEVIRAAIKAGVCGYVLKKASIKELEKAIRTVAKGEKFYMLEANDETESTEKNGSTHTHFHPDETIEPSSILNLLSKREIQIIRMIVNDVPGSEIADQLFISPKTVETHRRNIFRKLDIHSAVALTRIAIKHKLI